MHGMVHCMSGVASTGQWTSRPSVPGITTSDACLCGSAAGPRGRIVNTASPGSKYPGTEGQRQRLSAARRGTRLPPGRKKWAVTVWETGSRKAAASNDPANAQPRVRKRGRLMTRKWYAMQSWPKEQHPRRHTSMAPPMRRLVGQAFACSLRSARQRRMGGTKAQRSRKATSSIGLGVRGQAGASGSSGGGEFCGLARWHLSRHCGWSRVAGV